MATEWINEAAEDIAEEWRELDAAGAQTSQWKQSDAAGEKRIAELVATIIEKSWLAAFKTREESDIARRCNDTVSDLRGYDIVTENAIDHHIHLAYMAGMRDGKRASETLIQDLREVLHCWKDIDVALVKYPILTQAATGWMGQEVRDMRHTAKHAEGALELLNGN